MKKYFKYIFAVGVASMVLTSCTGDLDTEPLTDETLTPDKALSQEGALEMNVARIYAAFSISGTDGAGSGDITNDDKGETTFTRITWNLQELSTDEARIAWSDDGLNTLQFQQWTPSNRWLKLNFARLSYITAICNEFLIQTASKVDEGNVLELRAEVRALRALVYYQFLDLYRTAPFTDENTGIGAYFPKQASGEYLFNFIEKELTAVIDNLPEKSTSNYGKVNRYVADMMLANLYMNAEVYIGVDRAADAIPYLSDIIDKGGYSLEQNYRKNFSRDNDESQEMIFPLIFDNNHAQSYGGTQYLIAASCGSGLDSKSELGLVNAAWAGLRATKELVERFEEGDNRAYFWTKNEKGDRQVSITHWDDYTEGYPAIKYTNKYADGRDPEADETMSSVDYPFYRLADAYLLYVEAVKRTGMGDAAKAVSLYNQIRQRAGVSTISSLNDLTYTELLDERSRELYFEGHRRTDLIRFNCFTDNLNWEWKNGSQGGMMKIADKYVLFPIPEVDVDANPNLNQIWEGQPIANPVTE